MVDTVRNLNGIYGIDENSNTSSSAKQNSNEAPQVKVELSNSDDTNKSNDRSNLISNSANEEPINNENHQLTTGDILAGSAPIVSKLGSLPPKPNPVQTNLNEVNQKLTNAQNIHDENMKILDEAKKHHEFLSSDAATESMMPEHLRSNVTVEGAPSEFHLKPILEGGEAPENYAYKHVPPHLAKDALSASHVQQTLIPKNVSQALKTQEVAEGTKLYKLPSGAIIALDPRAAGSVSNLLEEKSNISDSARKEAHAKLEPHRTQAAEDLAKAEAEANRSKTAVKDLATRQDRLSSNLADIAGRNGSKIGNMVRYGGDLLGKLSVPAALASVPYEYQQAVESGKKAWESGNMKDWGETAKHTAGVASGALAAAPYLAAAGLLAPEVGAGLATTGAIGGLSILATEAPQFYRKYIQDRGE